MSSTLNFLPRPPAPLPSEQDFDPHGGDLDAQCAWRNFGGLTLAQAYDLFVSRPDIYQEDFMFMGSTAFEYYFPVIDCHLRDLPPDEDGCDDSEAWILGCAVAAQLGSNSATFSNRLVSEVEVLMSFVLSNTHRFATSPKDCLEIARAWRKVRAELEKYKRSRKAVNSTGTRVEPPSEREPGHGQS